MMFFHQLLHTYVYYEQCPTALVNMFSPACVTHGRRNKTSRSHALRGNAYLDAPRPGRAAMPMPAGSPDPPQSGGVCVTTQSVVTRLLFLLSVLVEERADALVAVRTSDRLGEELGDGLDDDLIR